MAGDYLKPIRVIAIDEAKGIVINVSAEIAQAIGRLVVHDHASICRDALEFCHWNGVYLQVEEAA
jgi:hypothetical protein